MTDVFSGKEELGKSFSPDMLVKIKIVESVFETFRLHTSRDEPLTDYTYQTSFARAVRDVTAMLWSDMPGRVKKRVTEAYDVLDKEVKRIKAEKNTNEPTLRKNLCTIEDETATAVYRLCILAFINSSMASSAETLDIKQDPDTLSDLISATRSERVVDIYEG